MRISTLSVALIACVLSACDPDPVAPAGESTKVEQPVSLDTLRYSIEPSFDGRTLLINWYHASFSSPLAVRSLANRPMAQAFALSGPAGSLALPARVDSGFEFYARFAQYAADEAKGGLKQAFVDSAAIYEATHRWALAPLVAVRTDELARLTFAQVGAGAKPVDSVVLQSGYVLLWVRDSIVAEQDGLLVRRKLTGKFRAGWHLLQYKDSGRSLTPRPFSDTVKFRVDSPKPNLV